MDKNAAKEFVISTIRHGNKDRIQKVLLHYWQFLKEKEKTAQENIVAEVKKIFNVS